MNGQAFLAFCVSSAYAIGFRLFFGANFAQDYYAVMSASFLFGLPFGLGVVAMFFSGARGLRNRWFALLFPWLPLLFFFAYTIITGVESWACWAMVLPVFLLFSSLGAFVSRYCFTNYKTTGRYITLLAILPFFTAPAEHLWGVQANHYTAEAAIEMNADAPAIWENILRVKAIRPSEDNGQLMRWLGFPRPLSAEFKNDSIGTSRAAIFTDGLKLKETIIFFDKRNKLELSIQGYAQPISSSVMDEHVMIGGDYFEVMKGTYELEYLGRRHYRLHLYSHFRMKTSFNFYAGFWGKLLMKDIQSNILHVVKERSETTTSLN